MTPYYALAVVIGLAVAALIIRTKRQEQAANAALTAALVSQVETPTGPDVSGSAGDVAGAPEVEWSLGA